LKNEKPWFLVYNFQPWTLMFHLLNPYFDTFTWIFLFVWWQLDWSTKKSSFIWSNPSCKYFYFVVLFSKQGIGDVLTNFPIPHIFELFSFILEWNKMWIISLSPLRFLLIDFFL
jgi:hypothetical protein